MSARMLFVIDDDADLRAAIAEELEASGFVVESFTGARAALDAFSRRRPAAIVVDRWLPEMNGDAFITAVRAADGQIPIVLMSGDSKIGHVAFGEGVVVLPKPFDLRRLLSAIHAAVGDEAD